MFYLERENLLVRFSFYFFRTLDTIIERLKSSETRQAAFQEIVGQFSKPLYQHIRRYVLYHEDADDILQNTFMKAWIGLDAFRGESKISTWLFRIAVNESLSFLGRQKENISLSNEENDVANCLMSDPYFDGDKTEALLQKAISLLPEKQRIIFNMKYFEEMKYEEMSSILNTSVGALKASYHIAVQKIQTFFKNLK